MSSFSLVRQPRKSRYCGHAVVAMFAGITLADAIAELGEKSATIGRIKRSLAKRGILFEKKPMVATNGRGPAAIQAFCLFEWHREDGKRKGHFVAWDGKRWFDPARGTYETLKPFYVGKRHSMYARRK